jgi:hypothetical protein
MLYVDSPVLVQHIQGCYLRGLCPMSGVLKLILVIKSGLRSSVGKATDNGMDGRGSNPGGVEIFRTCPDWTWGPPSLLYNGYLVFPGGKVWPGCAADHSSPSSAEVMEE